jgi:hypothetical protein
VEALLTVQRAKIELAREGARTMQLRGSRILAEPLELDSERVGRLRERIPGAIFSSREGTLTVRIDDADEGDEVRIAALDALADAVSRSREAEPAVA